MRLPLRPISMAISLLVLTACTSTPDIQQAVSDVNQAIPDFTQQHLELHTPAPTAARQAQVAQLLDKPLSRQDAVHLALLHSPAVQTLLAQNWANLSAAAQSGRINNPIFSFERLRAPDELEFSRMLSFGLLDVLTLPKRQAIARNQSLQAQTQLIADVVERITLVRQAWVRAVAAQQGLHYARQVHVASQTSAELARRMQQTGNFSRLQRASQHAFYADAVAQQASAQHQATATREELVRLLGLDDAQAARLVLPERLPNLPAAPRLPADINTAAPQERLDVRLARQQLDATTQAQGLNLLTSIIDIEAGVAHNTSFDRHSNDKTTTKGYALDIRLPLFDTGSAQRDGMSAQTLAAASRYDDVARSATSQLRQSYSTYRTTYDLARHYRDEIIPLRQTIAEENLLRYNGMFISVFDLLASSREHIASIMAAMDAQQQFWLADAALAASLMGQPTAATASTSVASSTTASH